MLCNSFLRSVGLWAGHIGRQAEVGQFRYICGDLYATTSLVSLSKCKFGIRRKMMVDSDATTKGSIVDVLPDKIDDGSYASGGWKSVMNEDFFLRFSLPSLICVLDIIWKRLEKVPLVWNSEDGSLSCGYSSFRGKRASMEDFYDIKASKIDGQSVCLFGVFDGHGGSRAGEYLKEHLFENLMKHPEFITNTKLAISETYQQTDRDFLESEKDTFRDDGSTASTAVLVGDHLYVANVGDSRTIISKAGRAIALSEDHKPNRSDERKRIESAGGVVMWAGTWRVGGVLAMSRAFGNRLLKQFVVAEPEIQEQVVDQDLDLLVLASDGLWDVVPNEDAVSIAQSEDDPEAAARKLTETAFTRGSADNITCVVVKFHHQKTNPDKTQQQHLVAKPQPKETQQQHGGAESQPKETQQQHGGAESQPKETEQQQLDVKSQTKESQQQQLEIKAQLEPMVTQPGEGDSPETSKPEVEETRQSF